MYTVMNILHVLAAVFIVGPMVILPMTGMRAIKAGQGGQVAVLAKSTFLFTLLSLLAVLFGFALVGLAEYDISVTTPWILISIVLYLIALGLNLAVVVPAMRGAARRLSTETGATTADHTPGNEYALVAMGSGISSILLVVVVILMVWRP